MRMSQMYKFTLTFTSAFLLEIMPWDGSGGQGHLCIFDSCIVSLPYPGKSGIQIIFFFLFLHKNICNGYS